jgi:hypothetical protein
MIMDKKSGFIKFPTFILYIVRKIATASMIRCNSPSLFASFSLLFF